MAMVHITPRPKGDLHVALRNELRPTKHMFEYATMPGQVSSGGRTMPGKPLFLRQIKWNFHCKLIQSGVRGDIAENRSAPAILSCMAMATVCGD